MNGVSPTRQWPDLGFGIALKTRHYHQFLQQRPQVDWLEVHTENYLGRGGFDLYTLLTLRRDYPFSLHGVGLGLGSARGFPESHLHKVVDLVRRVEPALVSEHLCWGAIADRTLNDLLPLGFNGKSLQILCEHIDQVQQALARPILLENVSAYLRFQQDSWSEAEFLAELVRRTGCGILLDVNNLYVNQCNHGEDPLAAIAALPVDCVGEIHLAGHLVLDDIVIDDHGSEVVPAVWELYRAALCRFGKVATMVEWDTNVPELPVMLAQAELARAHASNIAATPIEIAELAPRSAVQVDMALVQQCFGEAMFDAEKIPQVLAYFAGDSAIAEKRIYNYRGNMRANWGGALHNAYPTIEKLVGEEFFAGLVSEYGQRYPSNDPNLNIFGAYFADFLRDFEHVAQYPYFYDMARLDWALHTAYYEPDLEAVSVQHVASLSPEELENSFLQLHPACRLLQTDFAVDGIWQAHRHEPVQAFPDPLEVATFIVVTRPEWRCLPISLSRAAFTALSGLQQGQNLGSALDAALEVDEEFPFIEQLQMWLAQKMLIVAQQTANSTT